MSLAVLSVMLVACQNIELPAPEEVQGIPMTLTAGLTGEPGTKTTVTPDGSGLKSTWDADEAISVVTLDGDGKAVAIDNFTSSGEAGRTSADFSGSFTGGENPVKVIVIYPSLEKQADDSYQNAVLSQIKIGDNQCQWNVYGLRQTGNGDLSHFKNYCVMTGNVNLTNIKSNTLTVKLRNMMTVIKVVAQFPDDWKEKSLESLKILDNAHRGVFGAGGAAELDIEQHGFPSGLTSDQVLLYTSFAIPSSGTATLYIPVSGMKGKSNYMGDWWQITAVQNGGTTTVANLEFSKAVGYQAGKMYTVNVKFQ